MVRTSGWVWVTTCVAITLRRFIIRRAFVDALDHGQAVDDAHLGRARCLRWQDWPVRAASYEISCYIPRGMIRGPCPADAAGDVAIHSRTRESSQMVTGPSLTNATSMCAPNAPVATGLPAARAKASTNASNAGFAISGAAAPDHDGRLPLRVDACSVNWLTASTSPPTSRTDRFITPASSSKMRMSTILRASQSLSLIHI